MRKALAALALIASPLALATDLGGDGLGGPSLQPRAQSVQLGEPGIANRELSQVDPVLIEAGEPALDFRFAKNKNLIESTTNKSSLINFSRSAAQSPGTYVGADGLIHDAAVNLALYSEQFDLWTNYNSTDEANQSIAPDGKQTADIVRETVSSTGHSVYRTHTFDGLPKTYSAYIKKSSGTHNVGLGFYAGATSVKFAFNPETGAGVGSFGTEAFQYGSESVGNGWFRVWVSGIVASGSGGYAIYSVDGTTESFAGDTANSFLVWGAQLEETDPATMQPTAYIHTTSQALAAPRFDHDPVTGESLGLLVEEQRANLLTYSESFDVGWANIRSLDTANVATAPDGTATADYIEQSPSFTLQGGVQTTASSVPSTGTYTQSVYAKAGEKKFLIMGSTSIGAWFDLQNGQVGTVLTGNASIESAGNGWYKCSWTATFSAGNQPVFYLADTDGSSTVVASGGIYLWGAQLEAGSFATSYIPTVTSQTRYADVAAVQDEDFSTTNLLAYSESFDVGWYAGGVTVTPNDTTAPDGTLTADKLTVSPADTFGQQVTVPTSQQVTFSTYIKRGNNEWVRFGVWDSSGGTPVGTHQFRAWVNLQTKTLGTQSAVGNGVLNSVSVEDVGDDWLRLSITGSITGFQLYAPIVVSADADSSTGRVNGAEWYLWGASLTATEYPVEYTTTRNLQKDSQDFERSTYSKLALSSWGDGYQDPFGRDDGFRLVENSALGNHGLQFNVNYESATYALSFYAKKGARQYLEVLMSATDGASFAVFNLDDGSTVSTGAGTTASSQEIGNGWYRYMVSKSLSSASTTSRFRIGTNASTFFYTGDGASDVLLYGAQLEPGTTATDYVRTVDVVGKSYNWYEPTEGTVFSIASTVATGTRGIVGIDDDTANERIELQTDGTDPEFVVIDGGAGSTLDTGTITAYTFFSLTGAYKHNDLAATVGGLTVQTATDTLPTVDRMRIGVLQASGTYLNGHIKRLTYWPRRQSDSTLQVITQ